MKSKTNFKRDAMLVGIFLVMSFVLLKMPTLCGLYEA